MNLRTGVIFSAVSTVLAVAIYFPTLTFRQPSNQQGYAPIQPINFSHKIHAGDNKIPCLYCHFGAEKSAVAGIPPANVCMNCHSEVLKQSPEVQKIAHAIQSHQPIVWIKVHNLPRFVAFNHSRHVSVGVPCQTCHGPVETMDRVAQVQDLSMGWCVNCHRTYRASTIAGKTVQASTDCVVCHH